MLYLRARSPVALELTTTRWPFRPIAEGENTVDIGFLLCIGNTGLHFFVMR